MKSQTFALIRIIVLGSFFLTGCTQKSETENQKSNLEQPAEYDYKLENLFFYTIEELEEKFGKSNIQNEFTEACETCGPEGTPLYESYYTTTLFPNSDKEVRIYWNSDQTKVTEVSVERNGNQWRTKEGFRLGDSIDKINRYFKNEPVKMLYENYFYYQKKDYYTLMFSTEDLNWDYESLLSTDSDLKNLVLTAISLRLPGYSN